MDCSWMEGRFENLKPGTYEGKSEPSEDYNCIAYAMGRTDKPCWPTSEIGGYDWPDHLPRHKYGEETLENFVLAFGLQRYVKCDSGEVEEGCEKIAIYVGPNLNPKHAARQKSNGMWVSKLGDEEDVEHQTVSGLEGSFYGTVAQYMKRPRQS